MVLNYDNHGTKEMLETCLLKHRMLINPIIDWDDEDVWEFLSTNNIPHCCLYDEGSNRIGCIGCPMQNAKQIEKDFERWPKYKSMYIRAFDKMLKQRRENGLETSWQTPEEVFDWWVYGERKDDGTYDS